MYPLLYPNMDPNRYMGTCFIVPNFSYIAVTVLSHLIPLPKRGMCSAVSCQLIDNVGAGLG